MPSALCYRHHWIMNRIQNSGRKTAPRKLAGTSTAPVRLDEPAKAHHASVSAERSTAPRAHVCCWIHHPGSNFLIANPGLEFRLTPFNYTHLKISNREYIAVFHSGFSPISSLPHRSEAPNPGPNSRSLIARHRSLATAFLIETPRLEFPLTHTKQSSGLISNRDKSAFSHSQAQPRPPVVARPAPPCYTASERAMSPTP
jgi:hypothetical protein